MNWSFIYGGIAFLIGNIAGIFITSGYKEFDLSDVCFAPSLASLGLALVLIGLFS